MLSGTAFLSVCNEDKPKIAIVAQDLIKLGFELVATRGTTAAILALLHKGSQQVYCLQKIDKAYDQN